MKQKHHLFSFSLLLLFLLHCTTTLAQAPAPAPAPPGPTNVTKILEKVGQFSTLIRLMQQTSVDTQLYNQLNNSNNGITIFAPSDNAFSSLKPGTLNSLTDQQKVELIQFHVIPQHLSMSTFQTASNPLRTNAGDSADWLFPLNVTTSGNSVNITTGLTNTSVSGTVYTDDQLAIYQVDQVLQPPAIFNPSPPPPAPAPAPSKKKGHGAATDTSVPADASSPMHINIVVSVGVAIVAAFCL